LLDESGMEVVKLSPLAPFTEEQAVSQANFCYSSQLFFLQVSEKSNKIALSEKQS